MDPAQHLSITFFQIPVLLLVRFLLSSVAASFQFLGSGFPAPKHAKFVHVPVDWGDSTLELLRVNRKESLWTLC